MTPFSATLRFLRKHRRVTQQEVAVAVGLGKKTISAIEAGRRRALTDEQINRLTALLALTPDELRTLREAAHASSYTIRIPTDASPQAMRMAHALVPTLGDLCPAQVAALEAATEMVIRISPRAASRCQEENAMDG